jgi:Cd2+/Zn2+-exporting ATPase/Cu+-exporting ATPase
MTAGFRSESTAGFVGIRSLAAFGLLGPLLAAFIHVASELTFILNSARLLPGRADKTEAAAPTSAAEAQLR